MKSMAAIESLACHLRAISATVSADGCTAIYSNDSHAPLGSLIQSLATHWHSAPGRGSYHSSSGYYADNTRIGGIKLTLAANRNGRRLSRCLDPTVTLPSLAEIRWIVAARARKRLWAKPRSVRFPVNRRAMRTRACIYPPDDSSARDGIPCSHHVGDNARGNDYGRNFGRVVRRVPPRNFPPTLVRFAHLDKVFAPACASHWRASSTSGSLNPPLAREVVPRRFTFHSDLLIPRVCSVRESDGITYRAVPASVARTRAVRTSMVNPYNRKSRCRIANYSIRSQKHFDSGQSINKVGRSDAARSAELPCGQSIDRSRDLLDSS